MNIFQANLRGGTRSPTISFCIRLCGSFEVIPSSNAKIPNDMQQEESPSRVWIIDKSKFLNAYSITTAELYTMRKEKLLYLKTENTICHESNLSRLAAIKAAEMRPLIIITVSKTSKLLNMLLAPTFYNFKYHCTFASFKQREMYYLTNCGADRKTNVRAPLNFVTQN